MPMICPMTYRKPWISIRPSASKESRRGGLDLAVEGSAGSQVPLGLEVERLGRWGFNGGFECVFFFFCDDGWILLMMIWNGVLVVVSISFHGDFNEFLYNVTYSRYSMEGIHIYIYTHVHTYTHTYIYIQYIYIYIYIFHGLRQFSGGLSGGVACIWYFGVFLIVNGSQHVSATSTYLCEKIWDTMDAKDVGMMAGWVPVISLKLLG